MGRWVGYDADLHNDAFEVEGETGRQGNRLLGGLSVSLPGHEAQGLGAECWQVAKSPRTTEVAIMLSVLMPRIDMQRCWPFPTTITSSVPVTR
jgi:hypothetical protein